MRKRLLKFGFLLGAFLVGTLSAWATDWTSTNSLPTSAGSYKLTSDVTLTAEWVAPTGTTTIDLNGNMIKQTTSNQRVIRVGSGVTLTITDTNSSKARYWSYDATNKYWVNPQDTQPGDWAGNTTTGYLYTTGGCITGGFLNNDNGGGILINGGTLNLNGGNVVGNHVTASGEYWGGGGIMCTDVSGTNTAEGTTGSLTIGANAKVCGNSAYLAAEYVFGGGVHVRRGSCVNYGEISWNTAYTEPNETGQATCYSLGGGVGFTTNANNETSSFTNSGKLTHNFASVGGGAASWQNGTGSTCPFENAAGAEISYNTACSGGGLGLHTRSTNCLISGSIINNIADGKYTYGTPLKSSFIHGYGGGIMLHSGDLVLSEATITNNQVKNGGGGIYKMDTGDISIKGVVRITDNQMMGGSASSNLLLNSTSGGVPTKIALTSVNKPTSGSQIGISIREYNADQTIIGFCAGTFTSGGLANATIKSYFYADGVYPSGTTLNLTGSELAIGGIVTSGLCGTDGHNSDLRWYITGEADNYTLTISKSDGATTSTMKNYSTSDAPWYSYSAGIKQVVIGSGVTGIGNNAFYSCNPTSIVSLSNTPPSLGTNAFYSLNPEGAYTVYVPSGTTNSYRQAAGWSTYAANTICCQDVTAAESVAGANRVLTNSSYQATFYTSVETALNTVKQATSGAQHTVAILDDVTESITFSQSGKYVTIDLNDHLLTAEAGNRVITLTAGTLTIKDDAASTIRNWSEHANHYWVQNTNGTYTTTGGCITGGILASGSGAGINVASGATLNFSGGNIVGNYANAEISYGGGGGIYSEGNINIEANAVICGNATYRATGYPFGGGIYVKNGTTVNNGLITYNTSFTPQNTDNTYGLGGGVGLYATNTTSPRFTNNYRIDNNRASAGGGVATWGKDSGSFTNAATGIISENTASTGGGLALQGMPATISGSVTNNTADGLNTYGTPQANSFDNGCGGGIHARDNAITIVGATITGNTASLKGGGVYRATYTGTISLSGSVNISTNTLSSDGNPDNNLYLSSDKVATITEALTSSNIGVFMETPGEFTTGIADAATALTNHAFFTSDNDIYSVYPDATTNQLKLVNAAAELYTGSTLNDAFSTLGAAIVAADNGQTVKLIKDVTESFEYDKTGVSVTLDLNDKMIKATADNRVINLRAGTLTITDRTMVNADGNKLATQTGTTRSWYKNSDSEPCWTTSVNGSSVGTTKGGCITGGYFHPTSSAECFGAGIYVSSDATLTFTAGNVVGNRIINGVSAQVEQKGGGIYNAGTLTIGANATVCGNLVMSDNKSYYASGGGVCNFGTFTNSGIISHNIASCGGGIIQSTTGSFVNNGSIINNIASDRGGGIFSRQSLTLNEGTNITGNTCLGTTDFGHMANNIDDFTYGTGGAIFIKEENSTLTINGGSTGVEISDNTALRGGGGLSQKATSGAITFSGKIIISNNTLTDGTTPSNVLLTDGTITITDALTGSTIGVAKGTVSADGVTYEAGVITSGYTNVNSSTASVTEVTSIFTLDGSYDDSYMLVKNHTPELEIHQHTYNYTAADNVLTSGCSTKWNSTLACPLAQNPYTLTAAGGTYNGTAYTASQQSEEAELPEYTGWTKDAAISYYSTEEADAVTGGTSLGTTAPTNAGYYYAKYSVTPTAGDPVSAVKAFTIAKKPVTVSGITASNKVYDGNTTADLVLSSPTFTGIVEGDALTVTAPTTGTFADANVGTGKNVTISAFTLGGTDVANYQLAGSGQQTSTTADITARAITVTANEQTKAYGTVPDATTDNVTISSGTLATGDELNTVTITKDALVAEANQKTITPSVTLKKTSDDSNVTSNYAITYASGTLNETVTFNPGNTWSTYYWDAAEADQETAYLTTVEGLTPYTVTGVTDNVAATEETYIKANTPYLLNLTEAGEKTLTVSYNQAINGTPDAAFKYASTAVTCSENNNKYILNNGNFVWARSGSIPAGKCYIDLDTAGARQRVLGIIIGGGDGTTGINGVERSMMDVEGLYDMQGRKVESGNVRKGIYIKNGRKVVIK